SIIRRPLWDTRSRTNRFSDSSQKRLLCRLGRTRRRVLLLAWETLLPLCGRFPVTWHTLDMAVKSLIRCKIAEKFAHGGGQRAGLYTSDARRFQGRRGGACRPWYRTFGNASDHATARERGAVAVA